MLKVIAKKVNVEILKQIEANWIPGKSNYTIKKKEYTITKIEKVEGEKTKVQQTV